MKALFAFLLAFAWSVNAAISTATKPHTIDSAATPKVSYVDDNDEALLDKINELIDTTNLHNSSGAVVGDLFSSTGDMRLLVDSDNNGTNRWMVTANGATDTLWRILESGAWKGFGDGYVSGKVVASDSLVGATVRATGNLSAGGTFTASGASTLAALSATTATLSSSLTLNGETANRLLYLNGSKVASTSGNLTWDGSTFGLTGAQTISSTLGVTGASTLSGDNYATSFRFYSNTGAFLDTDAYPAIFASQDVSGSDPFNSNGHLILQARTGGTTGRAIRIYTGTTPTLRLNIDHTGLVAISGNSTIGGTLGVTGNLTLSTLSSGRIPVVSTAGLITQDNLYWDATNDRLGIGASASTPAGSLDIRKSQTSTLQGIVFNEDNTNTASHARWQATAGGASGGDAYLQLSINGVIDWSWGIDNSDNDAIVLSEASTLGTSNRLRISSTQLRAYGNLQVDGTADFTGAATFATNITQSAGVTTISVTDNTANAVDIQEGSNNYINVNTTNTAENVSIGNATTNPSYSFLGSGRVTINGPSTTTGAATFSSTVSTGALTATTVTTGGGEAFTYGDTSFTLTATGMTTSPTGTAHASRVGRIVTIQLPFITGTSNATSFTLTGVPSDYRPSTFDQEAAITLYQNNGTQESGGYCTVSTGGSITITRRDGALWTNSGTKSVNPANITFIAR